MGYYYRFSGHMDFSRELTFAEVTAMPEPAEDYPSVELDTTSHRERTDEGWLERIGAVGIKLTEVEEDRGNTVMDDLAGIFKALPEDVTVTGEFRMTGEQSPDVSRIVVSAEGYPNRIFPQLRWPDGQVEDVR